MTIVKGGENMAGVGSTIKKIRTEQGISREELGRRSGIAMHTLYKLENEIQENPRLDTLQSIADGLGVTVTELLENNGAKVG